MDVGSAGDGAEGGGADRSAVTGGRRLHEPALALGAQTVAVPRMVSTWLWWRSRSRIAVATTGSANTVPHSATLRSR